MYQNLYEHPLYMECVKKTATNRLPWEKLQGKTIVLSGGTGLLGSFFADVILYKNNTEHLGCHLIVLGRNKEKAKNHFHQFMDHSHFSFIVWDVNEAIPFHICENSDIVIHMASHTHPMDYAKDPIGTIMSNVLGTKNMLDFAVNHHCERFVFASSNEIYGENRGDQELFDEAYMGYIDCNTLRAGYPESKRCGEALCQAYKEQHGLDIVIPRFTRSFGPTLLSSDTKALSQFLHKALRKEDIILKSEGNQFFSYTFMADAVLGLFFVLLLGESGEAYNIADESCDIRLKDLANMTAEWANTKVIFELPNQTEAKGFSKATKARLDGEKIRKLGWKSMYDIKTGIFLTLDVLHQIELPK